MLAGKLFPINCLPKEDASEFRFGKRAEIVKSLFNRIPYRGFLDLRSLFREWSHPPTPPGRGVQVSLAEIAVSFRDQRRCGRLEVSLEGPAMPDYRLVPADLTGYGCVFFLGA